MLSSIRGRPCQRERLFDVSERLFGRRNDASDSPGAASVAWGAPAWRGICGLGRSLEVAEFSPGLLWAEHEVAVGAGSGDPIRGRPPSEREDRHRGSADPPEIGLSTGQSADPLRDVNAVRNRQELGPRHGNGPAAATPRPQPRPRPRPPATAGPRPKAQGSGLCVEQARQHSRLRGVSPPPATRRPSPGVRGPYRRSAEEGPSGRAGR